MRRRLINGLAIALLRPRMQHCKLKSLIVASISSSLSICEILTRICESIQPQINHSQYGSMGKGKRLSMKKIRKTHNLRRTLVIRRRGQPRR